MSHQGHLQRVDLLGVTGDVFGRQRELGIIEERREAQAVAVEVLAGEVNDHLLAGVQDRFTERGRGQHGIAAGVVGDRDPIDGLELDELVGEVAGADRLLFKDRAAGGDQFDPHQEVAGALEFLL